MENQGWISLHRKLRDNPIYRESSALHVWIECLLRACHEPKEFYSKRELIKLKPGQFLMGRDEFGKSIGMSGSTAFYWLKRFKADTMIDTYSVSGKGTVVTIMQWSEYQRVDTQVDKEKTRDEHGMNTNNNVNNGNNTLTKVNGPQKTVETKPVKFGNEILNDFMEYVRENNNEILPMDSTLPRTRQGYWNILQRLGVRNGMKLKADIPPDVKRRINRFGNWFVSEKASKGYTVENIQKLKTIVNNFLENHDDSKPKSARGN